MSQADFRGRYFAFPERDPGGVPFNVPWVPPHNHDTLENYMAHGYPPGRFIQSVLCNNLQGAVNSADGQNIEHITNIVRWCQVYLPAVAWGDEVRYLAWIADIDGLRSGWREAREREITAEILRA